MSDIPTIGDVVRRWREEHFKLNLTKFAERAGMSKGYVSAIERNEIKNPTDEKLAKLAEALGMTPMELLARKMPNSDVVGVLGTKQMQPHRASFIRGAPPLLQDQSVLHQQIEHLIEENRLAEDEIEIFEDRLVAVARELIELIKMTRKSG